MVLTVKIKKKLKIFTLDVNFSAEAGCMGILGASGSGKSMTLKCIAGVIRPDSGRIVLNGRVLFDSRRGIDLRPQQRRVGYLFQNYALFPHMTVTENIACGRGIPAKGARQDAQIGIAHRIHPPAQQRKADRKIADAQKFVFGRHACHRFWDRREPACFRLTLA